MPKVTIDGQQVEVPAKTTILRAAKQVGVEIPVFCYHPGLSIVANCRMCLVEIEKWPKPQPACYTEVSEGMVIHTQSAKVKHTQEQVLEFILLNHPVDCPVCDQAGECVLQEHYATYSGKASRLSHVKSGKPKAKPLGPTVVLDAERCVVCTRCVRFCEEVTKTNELTLEDRGEHAEITTPAGVQLDNPYSLNVVDICPVGALTSRQFRFQRRVWFLDMKPSVCTGCARGCSIRVDSHANKVERLVPRYNPDVNNYWMCDDGRHSLSVAGDSAIAVGWAPGPGSEVRQAPAQDGLRVVANWLQEARTHQTAVAIVLSASLTNEDAYAWGRLAKEMAAEVFLLPRAPWQGDDILRTADRDCNLMGAQAILQATVGNFGDAAAFVARAETFGLAIAVDNGADATDEFVDAFGSVDQRAVMTDRSGALSAVAEVVVPLTPLHQRDGTIVNQAGWVQRLAKPLRPAITTVAAHVAAAALAPSAIEVLLDFTQKTQPAELFARVAASVAAFKNLTYNEIGDLGRGLTHGGELAPARVRLDGTAVWEPDPVAPTYQRPFQIRRGA
ncbi:MAG: 2Fe-2S iron-sulfur cluster binding domain-containing protein [Myxococcales bacterium]|nr:2Fe-2S iron-sulfur cluster binding domain-containing protein [Myxococcales bacterium]